MKKRMCSIITVLALVLSLLAFPSLTQAAPNFSDIFGGFDQLDHKYNIIKKDISTYDAAKGPLYINIRWPKDATEVAVRLYNDKYEFFNTFSPGGLYPGWAEVHVPSEAPQGVYRIEFQIWIPCPPDYPDVWPPYFEYSEPRTIRIENSRSPAVAVTGIDLENGDSCEIIKGKTLQLKATLKPSNATDTSIKWSSSNPKVATVDTNGKVKGLNNGVARITATSGNGKTASCKVTVKTPATAIKLKQTSVTIAKGKTAQLSVVSYTPASVYPKTIKWTSSNSKIATVDSTGKVRAVKTGTTYINAKTWNGVTAKCKVVVK